jgi:DNA primase
MNEQHLRQYAELFCHCRDIYAVQKPDGGYFLVRGPCPFHPPDERPSFVVNREKGYWVCFHEVNQETGRYLGGDAIEFYRRLKGLGFKEAVRELSAQYGVGDLPF